MVKKMIKIYNKKTGYFVAAIVDLFVISILFSIVFNVYYNSVFKVFQVRQINYIQERAIEKLDEFSQEIAKTAVEMLDEDDINNFIAGNSADVITAHKAYQRFNFYKVFRNINSVIIYDNKKGLVIDGTDLKRYDVGEYKTINPEWFDLIERRKNGENFFNCTLNNENSICCIYNDYRGYDIAFYFNEKRLIKDIIPDIYPLKRESWIFYDKDYLIITDAEENPKGELLQEIKKLNNIDNCLKYNKKLYIYYNAGDFTYIASISTGDMFSGALRTTLFLWVMVIFLLIISVAGTYGCVVFFRKNTKKYTQQIIQVEKKSKLSTIMYKLFLMENVSESDMNCLRDKFVINSDSSLRVMIVRMDNYNRMVFENGKEDVSLLKYGLCNIIEEILNGIGICGTVVLEKGKIGIILSTSSKISDDRLIESIEEIRGNTLKYLDTTLAFTIGTVFKGTEDFSEKFGKILKCSEYSFFYENNANIFEKNVFFGKKLAQFPSDFYDGIIKGISTSDDKMTEGYIDKLKEFLLANCFENTKELILTEYILFAHNNNVNREIDGNIITKLMECDTLEASMEVLKGAFCCSKSNEESAEKNDMFIATVERSVKNNFGNPDFRIMDIADELGLTVAYAGRKFKQVFGDSFNNYIAKYRVDMAIEFLTTTNKKISEISQICGFRTAAYFITIFKKYTTRTPQEYRDYAVSRLNRQ